MLVGCEDVAGVEAMLTRFTDSLRRVTSARQCEIDLVFGTMAVEDADSPEVALHHAEQSIGNVAAPATPVRGR